MFSLMKSSLYFFISVFGLNPWINITMLNNGDFDFINTMSYYWDENGSIFRWEKDINLWDISAGILMVKEAGGRISKINGDEWSIETREVLASNSKIHQELEKKLSLL